MGKYVREKPKTKKARRHRFRGFMIVYSLILILAISVGLFALWKFVDAYEKSLPDGVIEEYKVSALQKEYQDELSQYAESLKTPFQTGEEILPLLAGEGEALNLKKDPAESVENPVYIIRLGKKAIGKVFCTRENLPFPNFGFQACKVDHSEWRFEDDLGVTYEISAPQEAVVCVNDVPLNKQNSKEELKALSPTLISQGLEGLSENKYSFVYYGEPEITVQKSDRLEFEILKSTEQCFVVEASILPETCTELAAYAENFVRDYLAYTSNAGGAYTVLQYLIKDTSMYNRIAGSLDGMRWVLGVTATISDLKVDTFTPYGEAVMCEAHYNLTDLDGNTVPANMRLLLVQQEDGWKVYNIEMF